jgi:putative methionine-R-sulfoxide reductase with GAF domain
MRDPAIDTRDYAGIVKGLPSRIRELPREQRMQVVVDAVWDALHDHGVSWVGFYVDHPEQPDDQRLILGPCRNKPACSPLGMHGVCGQTLLRKQVMIVRDPAELGPNYIACDPRDRAEVAIPLVDDDGQCWGVFDVDSWEVGAFDERDAAGFAEVLCAAGLQPLTA